MKRLSLKGRSFEETYTYRIGKSLTHEKAIIEGRRNVIHISADTHILPNVDSSDSLGKEILTYLLGLLGSRVGVISVGIAP